MAALRKFVTLTLGEKREWMESYRRQKHWLYPDDSLPNIDDHFTGLEYYEAKLSAEIILWLREVYHDDAEQIRLWLHTSLYRLPFGGLAPMDLAMHNKLLDLHFYVRCMHGEYKLIAKSIRR